MAISATSHSAQVTVILSRSNDGAGSGSDALSEAILKKVDEEVLQKQAAGSVYPNGPGSPSGEVTVEVKAQFNPKDFFGPDPSPGKSSTYKQYWNRPAKSAGFKVLTALQEKGHQNVKVEPGSEGNGNPFIKINFKVNPKLLPSMQMAGIQPFAFDRSEFEDV